MFSLLQSVPHYTLIASQIQMLVYKECYLYQDVYDHFCQAKKSSVEQLVILCTILLIGFVISNPSKYLY
jgi:hypothetical protein